MIFQIQYEEAVVKKDIPKLSVKNKEKIKNSIEQKLTTEPDKFGKPLRRSLKGYRKLRVGDHRVIFRIEKNTIKIFIIEHRSIVYKHAKTRVLK